MNVKVLLAVFKRNFVSYFASPTGYVFICVFVLLSSFAAFLPDDFFNQNLANLDQLNRWFPFIMLVFIPAISMGVWADERRLGTDELLLTIPASDLDVVLGKYLAALAIYTVSLLFSLVCNLWVLETLGSPDLGLFLSTYVGYWLVGLAMLAIGMVASFLTGNLTIAYILGALFNAPLVIFVWADSVSNRTLGEAVSQWSLGKQFDEFGRGILSFSHLLYFLTIVAAMLYLSMVFIGRRHWRSGASSLPNYVLYAVQVGALVVIGGNLCLLTGRADVRADVTSERLSSLSDDTLTLLKGLSDIEYPVQIEAFISPSVPEAYVQTRLNLVARLRELKAKGGSKVLLRINNTERFSEDAARAEERFGISARRVTTVNRGTFSEEFIFLGVAFNCGLEKVILPFVDRGIPVEYELVRSIATVTQQKRKRIGVLQTDAELYGGFNMQSMSSRPNWPIIDELEKQYDVVRVDATNPIEERYDALLAVQPSCLGPEQMDNFINAVRSGQPTAIFEDPFPAFAASVPATMAPRQAPGGMNAMMMGGQRPPEKARPDQLAQLWSMLGIDYAGDKVIWQDYNPYPRFADYPTEFVFVDAGEGEEEPFSDSAPISSKLQHMLFPFPGSISKLNASDNEFIPLVRTGDKSGTVAYFDMVQMSPFGQMGGLNPDRRQVPGNVSYVLAAQIRGKLPAVPSSDEKDAAPQPGEINVVLVTDIDMLTQAFFRIREQGDIPEAGISFDFDNVTFVLNILDALADDPRFIEIRKRRPAHRTLTKIETQTETARKSTAKTREDLQKKHEEALATQRSALEDDIKKLQEDLQKGGGMDMLAVAQRVETIRRTRQQRLDRDIEQLDREKDEAIQRIEAQLSRDIRSVQDMYKMRAVILPPILPLLVAVVVFFTRRRREREGVAQSRLRS
jgi:ABC-2 type transport system permease protein